MSTKCSYYPQLLAVSEDVTAEWVLDLWTLAPTPTKAARLREATLARLLQRHRIRRLDAEQVVGLLRQRAITVAEGVTEAAVLHLRSLVARLRLANREFHQAERKLDELCTNLRDKTATPKKGGPCDAAVLSSLPGIGTVTLATLLTEAAGPIKRRDYAALRTLSGVAPVTKRSGKSCIVTMRYAAQVRLRNAVFHWARVAVLNDPKCASRYAALRARGHSYGRALRGVADRLLGVACVLLQRGMLFDPDHGTPTAPQSQRSLSSTGTDIPSSRPTFGKAPRASAVREAAQRHWRKPARNVLGSGSTVLRSTGRKGAPHASKRRCFVKHSNLITGRKSHQALEFCDKLVGYKGSQLCNHKRREVMRKMTKAVLLSALILVPAAAYAAKPPIRSPRDIACRQEAAKQVSSQPRGLSRYSRSRQIWLECMKRPR